MTDSVSFDPGYYGQSMLTSLIQQSSVVVLPYDSTEQVTSGVLVNAIANGRPVVATAFPSMPPSCSTPERASSSITTTP